jgi:hypothetical protein
MVQRSVLLLLAGLAAVASDATHANQPGELIERTLAIVGGQIITLSDVHAATRFGLVEQQSGANNLGATTEALIDRALMLREVQRYSPPEPLEAEVARRLSEIRKRFSGDDEFARALEAVGLTEQRLQSWVRDDLRIESYLNQRLADDRRAALIADWIADLRRRTPVVQLWKQ